MPIHVEFHFGTAIAHLQGKTIKADLEEGAKVRDAVAYLRKEHPLIATRLVAAQAFINAHRVTLDTQLHDGDEIWFISHIIGGET